MTDVKGKSPETIVLRFVWLESLTQDYTNAEIGQIIRDLYHYASKGTEPQQYADRGMRGLWRSMKDGVDKDFSKYREKSQKNSEAAKARWEKQTQKDDVSDVQTDANALCEMRTHTVASDCMHSHPTDTCTCTTTVTPEAPAAAADSRTDSGLAEIVQHFQEVIGLFPRSALNKLQRWRGIYSVEIIRAAIDEAAENNVRKWRYVDGVLKGWQADGVRTLGDVEARREARKKPEQQERKFEVLT